VLYSLPHALHARGTDIRLVLPGYRALLRQLVRCAFSAGRRARCRRHRQRADSGNAPSRILLFRCGWSTFRRCSNRAATPCHANGQDWPDNASASRCLRAWPALLAQDALDIGWQPAVVHTHDWQTGLVAAFLADQPLRPKTRSPFTTSPYAAIFRTAIRAPAVAQPLVVARRGGISRWLFDAEGGHYSRRRRHHGEPTTPPKSAPEFGYRTRWPAAFPANKLHAISTDRYPYMEPDPPIRICPRHYSMGRIQPGKRPQQAGPARALFLPLRRRCGDAGAAAGVVGRLVEQKGVDWVLAAMPVLLCRTDVRMCLAGQRAGDV